MSNKIVFSDNPQELQTKIYGDYSNQPKAIKTDSEGNYLLNYPLLMEQIVLIVFL